MNSFTRLIIIVNHFMSLWHTTSGFFFFWWFDFCSECAQALRCSHSRLFRWQFQSLDYEKPGLSSQSALQFWFISDSQLHSHTKSYLSSPCEFSSLETLYGPTHSSSSLKRSSCNPKPSEGASFVLCSIISVYLRLSWRKSLHVPLNQKLVRSVRGFLRLNHLTILS